MDFAKIKNLVKQNGDKFIIIENGEPEIVVMSFQEFERISAQGYMGVKDRNQPMAAVHATDDAEKIRNPHNQYQALETYPETMVVGESPGLPVNLEDVRLEDLPI